MMKRVVLTFVVLLSFISSWSQTDEISKEQADKLNAVTIKLMNQERYDDAIKTKERELVILKALNGETDSTYIKQLAFSAKLYYRNNQPEEAVKAIEKALSLYAVHVSNDDVFYAYFLDNLSLYQITLKEYAKAASNCRKALTIYEKLGRNDYDLAAILMHMAESSHYNGETTEAIKYEIRALNVIKKVCGEHSDEYIDELPYLQKYYQAVNDDKNAKQVEEMISRLEKEKEKVECQIAAGYVFDCVDEMPSFPGGRQSLLEFIEKNFCYPEDLAETCFHGRVIITFIVEESGELTDIRVVKGLHPSLDKEAIRIVKKMPRWIPGKQYGRNVRVKYTIPVKIFD